MSMNKRLISPGDCEKHRQSQYTYSTYQMKNKTRHISYGTDCMSQPIDCYFMPILHLGAINVKYKSVCLCHNSGKRVSTQKSISLIENPYFICIMENISLCVSIIHSMNSMYTRSFVVYFYNTTLTFNSFKFVAITFND